MVVASVTYPVSQMMETHRYGMASTVKFIYFRSLSRCNFFLSLMKIFELCDISTHGPRERFRKIKLIVTFLDGFHVYGSLIGRVFYEHQNNKKLQNGVKR